MADSAVIAGLYAIFGVNPYYFQLVQKDIEKEEAKELAQEIGQEVFPSGGTKESLKESSLNRWTWVLVFLSTVSYGGGFTALSTWYPTYWKLFHELSLTTAGLLAGLFVVYSSLVRIPAGASATGSAARTSPL